MLIYLICLQLSINQKLLRSQENHEKPKLQNIKIHSSFSEISTHTDLSDAS